MHQLKINMINIFPITNIYEKPQNSSKLSSQMLYGEKFSVITKNKNWLKIKTNFDNYTGFIKNKKFLENFQPNYKVSKIKSRIFKKIDNKFKPTKKFLYFASKIETQNIYKNFLEYEKNKWIKKSDLKKINHKEKKISKVIKLFLDTKYLWGGKSAYGIDCSALIQIYYYYNNSFFERDTKDQIKSIKTIPNKKIYDRKQLIFWKGHVAYCLNKKYLIHAYGPKKKVLIMEIKKTINEIEKKSKLTVKGVRKLNVI